MGLEVGLTTYVREDRAQKQKKISELFLSRSDVLAH